MASWRLGDGGRWDQEPGRSRGRTWLGACSAGAVALGFCFPATAAAQSEQSLSDTATSVTQVEEEIVVTAQKREQSAQEVPASLSVLSASQIQDRGINTVADLLTQVSSVQLMDSIGSSAVIIRGVGLTENSGSTAPGVAFYDDGVYQTHAGTAGLAYLDLQRIEVLRGPQGTLYGRNATGGAINVIENSPTSEFGGRVRLGYSSYDSYQALGILNAPLSEHLRTRLVLNFDQEGDYISNVASGPDLGGHRSYAGRFKIAADLSPNLELDASIYGLRGREGLYTVPLRPIDPIVGFLQPPLAGAQASGPWQTSANEGEDAHRHLYGGDVKLILSDDDLRITSITGFQRHKLNYNHLDCDGTNVNFCDGMGDQRVDTFVQQFDLSYEIGRATVLAGLSYVDDDFRFISNFSWPLGISYGFGTGQDPGGGLPSDYENNTKSYAGYVDATVAVADTVDVFGGVRYTRDDLEVTQSNAITSFNDGFNPPFDIVACSGQVTDLSFDATTWRAGVQWQPTDEINAYATVSRGFKSGGVNISACGDDFAPEEVTSYETGVKYQSSDRRVTFNASIFQYDYTDIQVQQFIISSLNITNAASATVLGAELDAALRLDDHWSFDANATFLDARYGTYSDVSTDPNHFGPADLTDNYLSNSPPYSVAVGLQYTTGELSIGRFTARAEARFAGKTHYTPFNFPEDAQSPYNVENFSLIWESPDAATTARFYVSNAFDQDYISTLAPALGIKLGTYGPPQRVGLQLTREF